MNLGPYRLSPPPEHPQTQGPHISLARRKWRALGWAVFPPLKEDDMGFDLDRDEVEEAVEDGQADFLWAAHENMRLSADRWHQVTVALQRDRDAAYRALADLAGCVGLQLPLDYPQDALAQELLRRHHQVLWAALSYAQALKQDPSL